ncbi:MAG TPA: tetratricopeptide repeat protein [Mariprofundaceae bacterium]|nr:tetratricopeptide repeat protein [Mariprofundaceae bacterium]
MADNKNETNPAVEGELSGEHLAELKRDMRAASMAAWVKGHQKQLIAAVLTVIAVIVAASLWVQHARSQKNAAATLYYQAMATPDDSSKQSLMQSVVKDYGSTAYAELALMQLAKFDRAHAEQHLKTLLGKSSLTPELRWQARLDLAQFYLQHHQAEQARAQLHDAVGPHYEQMRQFLLGEAVQDKAEKIGHYQKALEAISHDTSLNERIKRRLASLKGDSSSSATAAE